MPRARSSAADNVCRDCRRGTCPRKREDRLPPEVRQSPSDSPSGSGISWEAPSSFGLSLSRSAESRSGNAHPPNDGREADVLANGVPRPVHLQEDKPWRPLRQGALERRKGLFAIANLRL